MTNMFRSRVTQIAPRNLSNMLISVTPENTALCSLVTLEIFHLAQFNQFEMTAFMSPSSFLSPETEWRLTEVQNTTFYWIKFVKSKQGKHALCLQNCLLLNCNIMGIFKIQSLCRYYALTIASCWHIWPCSVSDHVSNGISRKWIYFPLDFRQRYHCRAGTKHTSVGLATKFNTYWTIFISSEDNVGPVAEVNNI